MTKRYSLFLITAIMLCVGLIFLSGCDDKKQDSNAHQHQTTSREQQ